MLGLVLSASLWLAPESRTLFRGAPVGEVGHWAVTDTFLDSQRPDENFGRDTLLTAGPGKTVLIQFGDLSRSLGLGRQVSQAQLKLTFAIGETAELQSIGAVLQPWGEGPSRRGFQLPRPGEKPADPNAKPVTPIGAASWKFRVGGKGGFGWDTDGATGVKDIRPLSGVTTRVEGGQLILEGIGPIVQEWIENPSGNFGLAIRFSSVVDFFSSDAVRGRPQLVVESSPPSVNGPTWSVGPIVEDLTTPTSWPANGTAVKFRAKVFNVGEELSSGFDVRWRVRGKEVLSQRIETGISPGEPRELTLDTTFESDPSDARRNPVELEIIPLKKAPVERSLIATYWMGGKTVAIDSFGGEFGSAAQMGGWDSASEWLRTQIQWLNEVALPQSKFAAFPEGVTERFNFAPTAAKAQVVLNLERSAPDLQGIAQGQWRPGYVFRAIRQAMGLPDYAATSAWVAEGGRVNLPVRPSLSGGGDTRDDDALLPGVGLPEDGWFSPSLIASPLSATNLLSRTDVGILNAGVGQIKLDPAGFMPRLVIVRLTNGMGQAVPNAQVQVFGVGTDGKPSETPLLTTTSSEQGTVRLPSGAASPFAQSKLLMVTVKVGGSTDTAWLPAWRAQDESFRGAAAAAIIELRVNVSNLGTDEAKKLSLNRIISDSANRAPAQLVALVDGNLSTSTEITGGPGSWVEVDLGRDRLVTEIRLVLPEQKLWSTFDLLRYGTAQKAGDALPFAKEVFGDWAVQARAEKVGDQWVIRYRGRAVTMRYVRLAVPSAGAIRVSELEVMGANAPESNP